MSKKNYVEQEGEKMEIWMPEKEGDELVGVVEEIKLGDYGKQYLVKQDDDAEIWTPSHKVLQNRAVEVTVGDDVKIVYDGTEPAKKKGNNPTTMYKVFIADK